MRKEYGVPYGKIMLRYKLQLSLMRLVCITVLWQNNHITHAVAVITKHYDDILTDLICSDITLEKKTSTEVRT